MFIKQITIAGAPGNDDVEITRSDRGAIVSANDVSIHVDRDDSAEDRFAVAYNAAIVIFGTDARNAGRPNATNSMIHAVMREIERVAGC